MIRLVHCFIAAAAALVTGCVQTPPTALPPTPPVVPARPITRVTLFVPGVFGDGAWYDGLRAAIGQSGSVVRTLHWGRAKPIFAANFSDPAVHAEAEKALADALDAMRGPVDLVGHSAGCGVILGGLAKARRGVGHVVLLAPSVSPGYDLSAALAKGGRIDAFISDRDTLFLQWRCGTFGTYDGVKTAAAGFGGFDRRDVRLVQHRYDPAWQQYGNAGGHSDGIGEAFVRAVVVPVLTGP